MDQTASPAPLRVLLIDDDNFTLDLLSAMLQALGPMDVACQSGARAALQALRARPPELLICDLSMPGMDGIEFLHAAAEAGFGGHVMLLSGMDPGVRRAAERLARAHGLQLLGAFEKPISQDQLRAALATLPGRAGPGRENLHNVTTLSGK